MTILVFGKNGQVARELQNRGEVIALGREEVNLLHPEQCAKAIYHYRPDAIINAAAYTAVDNAENDEASALSINGDSPTLMAKVAADLGIPIVHISTDYVFDGSGKTPWKPYDETRPLGVYGRTKLAGENGVVSEGGTHAILRTSWVFSCHGNNFVKAMLKLGAERDRLTIVADQIGGPTSAADIAVACFKIAECLIQNPHLSGTFHFAGARPVSWADFAREIFSQSGLSPEVVDIPSSEYPTPAKRPKNSRLDCNALEKFNLSAPQWEQSLAAVLKDLGEIK